MNELIDRLCAVDLLHVDDVGAEQSSPWVLEQLYAIVNTRYEDGRAMLLTTNLITRDGDDALRAQIGERTVSRLYEMCGEPMHMYGDDQRALTYACPTTPCRAADRDVGAARVRRTAAGRALAS